MNKAYKYILLILLLLSPIACRPFSISADGGSLSAPFVGFNVHVIDIDSQLNQIDRGNYRIASHTYGATGQLNCSAWRSSSDVSSPCDIYELESQGNSQVAGIQIKVGDISLTNLTNDQFTGTIINRVYEIEFILDNSYVGYITFSESGNSYTDYVNGTSFKHTFWSTSAQSFDISITDYKLLLNHNNQWYFPVESLNAVGFVYNYKQPVNTWENGIYTYPSFEFTNGDILYSMSVPNNVELLLIFEINQNVSNINTFNSFFSNNIDSSGVNVTNVSFIQSYRDTNNQWHTLTKAYIKNNSGSNQYLTVTYKNSSSSIITPIYATRTNLPNYISSDFALNYGLSNTMLDNIDKLANGTNQSNASSDNLDDNNDTMSDTIGQYDSIENSFNNSLNSSLNNINTNNTPSAMGSKFQSSAIWVTNQFNRITNNTPFGSILGFSLLLGLSLLIIGRVFK